MFLRVVAANAGTITPGVNCCGGIDHSVETRVLAAAISAIALTLESRRSP
jgi:hypothetical protein